VYLLKNYFIFREYTIMKDKVAQRERTDALVGGARTFNEFVKEKAVANNITPACVRSLPEVKEEWKQIKEKQNAEKKAQKLAKKAETKAEKKALSDAKKAEKKAEKKAKKAEKTADKEIRQEKTAIKKVAKKSAVDTENIKMTLIEKAHKKSQAEKPPQEPKVKGRPKKYATAEEARRAKIEQTKAINKAKKAQQPPKEKKAPKEKPSKLDPDVSDAELKIYMAKTDKDLDDVLKSIRKASVKYDKLNELNKKSYDHTLQIYTQKRKALLEKRRKEDDEKDAELERKKKEKATASRAVSQGKAERQRNIQMFKDARVNIKKDRERRMADLEEGEIYEEPMRIRPATPPPKRPEPPAPQPLASTLIPQAVANNRKRLEAVREALHEKIMETILFQPVDKDGNFIVEHHENVSQEYLEKLDLDVLARDFVDGELVDLAKMKHEYEDDYYRIPINKYGKKFEPYFLWSVSKDNPNNEGFTYAWDSDRERYGVLNRPATKKELETAKKVYDLYQTMMWVTEITEPRDMKPLLRQLDKVNRELDIKVGKGYNANDLKEFKNYGKIQDHLSQHLNDLKEAVDPKDLRDYIHFTKEKARLKSKLVGGLVRMIGGKMSDSDSDSD
jgi:hypothetical protein